MEEFDINKCWINILKTLEKDIPSSTYEPWILPLVPQSYDENGFNILSGQNLAIQILNKNYYDVIKNAISKELGKEVEFKIIYDDNIRKQLSKRKPKSQIKPITKNSSDEDKYEALKQMQSSANLNLKYNFDNFVVGDNSKLAYVASKSVAENPGKSYNPLFIYGGVGLGKTHLMQAIGHYVLHKHPKLKVKYIKTEDFINDYINSVFKDSGKNDKMNSFRQKYRSVDVLLIDDIQFIEGKERTEVEIFNTFETLYNAGKQIVLTSDRPPSAIPNLSDRLKSRFEWGLMADIQVPDLETRAAIVSKLCLSTEVKFPNNVIFLLAKTYNKNIRELEGAFIRLNAYCQINDVALTEELANKILNLKQTDKKLTVEDIIENVASYYDLKPADILSSMRSSKISLARQLVIYLCRELNGDSFSHIAKSLDKKHTTIMYSYEKIKDAIKNKPNIAIDLSNIKNNM